MDNKYGFVIWDITNEKNKMADMDVSYIINIAYVLQAPENAMDQWFCYIQQKMKKSK